MKGANFEKPVAKPRFQSAALLFLVAVSFCAHAKARPASAPPLAEAIRKVAARHRFQGVIALARGETLVASHAFGLADRRTRAPNTIHTRFQIGSISKWLTTLVVLRLADEGRLALDEPISRRLTRYPPAIGNRVDISQLLSNTSGIQDRLPTALINDPALSSSAMDATTAASVYGRGPIVFTPGSRFDYSHTNWMLVQAIVESASGDSFDQALSSRLLKPLKLNDSGVTHGSFADMDGAAIAYESADERAARDVHVLPAFVSPTGTLYSTANDLARLVHRVFHSGFLSPKMRAALSSIHWPEENYALGGRMLTRTLVGQKKMLAFEIGSIGGFKALLMHVVNDDVSVVLLNNANMPEEELTQVADALLAAMYANDRKHRSASRG